MTDLRNLSNYDIARSALDALLDDEANGQDRPLIEHRAQVHALLAVADAIRETRAPAPEPTSTPADLPDRHTHNGVTYDLSLAYVGWGGARYRFAGRALDGSPLMFDESEIDEDGGPKPYARAFTLANLIKTHGSLTVAEAGQ